MKRKEILKQFKSYLTDDSRGTITRWKMYLVLLNAQKKKSYAVIQPKFLTDYLPTEVIKKLGIPGSWLEKSVEDFMEAIYSSAYIDLETELELKNYLLDNFYGRTHIIFTDVNNLNEHL